MRRTTPLPLLTFASRVARCIGTTTSTDQNSPPSTARYATPALFFRIHFFNTFAAASLAEDGRDMKSVVAAAATLLLLSLVLDKPGGAVLAQNTGFGRATDISPSPADDDRSILLQWRATNPWLQDFWSDLNAPLASWKGVTADKKNGRVVEIEIHSPQRLIVERLTGTVPAALGNLTALTALDLSGNWLNGTVPATLGNLSELTSFNLSGNALEGSVPATLGKLAALTELDISRNMLNGTLPATLGQLRALTSLRLDRNELNGTAPAAFETLLLLEKLDLSSNELRSLPASLGKLLSLRELYLDRNNLEKLPEEIGKLKTLTNLSVAYNKLSELPASIGELSALVSLELDLNDLQSLPPNIGKLPTLRVMDLSSNNLSSLPAELGELSTLESLFLGLNRLETLPRELGKLTSLTELDVKQNQLSSLPDDMFVGLPALTKLSLSYNQLTGVPKVLGKLKSLTTLSLGGNQLTIIPKEIDNLTALESLTLGENQLTSLPAELGKLISLRFLSLDDNQLTTLPNELGGLPLLTSLSLDNNKLTRFPNALGNISTLSNLNLKNNTMTSLPPEIGNLTALTELNLDMNQITILPAELGRLTSLELLYLSENQLETVPAELGNLAHLDGLYIDNNNLTAIPKQLGKLNALTTLYLAYNPRLTSLPEEVEQLSTTRGGNCTISLLSRNQQCAKANEENKCNATLHCLGELPELSPDDGWKTTVLRENDTDGQYFNGQLARMENETLVGVSLSWRFKDRAESLVEFAIRYWSGCYMPHVKIGFPSPTTANNVSPRGNTSDWLGQLPCAVNFTYVDMEQISSTKSYCTGPSGDTQECDMGALGTVRIVEYAEGFCGRNKKEQADFKGGWAPKPAPKPPPYKELTDASSCSMTCVSGANVGYRATFARRSPEVVDGAPATVVYATREGVNGCAGGFCPDMREMSRGVVSFVW